MEEQQEEEEEEQQEEEEQEQQQQEKKEVSIVSNTRGHDCVQDGVGFGQDAL